MYVHVPTNSMPSPRAKKLGERIAAAVRLLREEDPEIGPEDVRRGLDLAYRDLRRDFGDAAGRRALGIAMIALSVGGFAAFLIATGGVVEKPWLIAVTIVSIAITTAGILLARKG